MVAAYGQTPSATGNISGKVVNARTGQAVPRCNVLVETISEGAGASRSVITEADGQFHFSGLPIGKYRLTGNAHGYLTQSFDQHDNLSTAIAVGPKLKSEDLIFNLVPQSEIYGVITDEAGEPIRRAQVQLYWDQDSLGTRSTERRGMGLSDDRGMYEISEIGPGTYFLAVSSQPWYSQGMAGAPAENGQESALNVAYPTTYFPNATDSDEATPIPVKGGERIEANITLNAQHALHLRMRLPASEQGYGIMLEKSVFGHAESVATNTRATPDGMVEIDGVLPGHYDVVASQVAPNAPQTSTRFSVDVDAGSTDLNPDTAVQEVSVTGKVTIPGNKAVPGGMALVCKHPRRDYFAGINQAGEFSFSVPPGEYEIVGQLRGMYLSSISSQNAPVQGHMLQVKAGSAPKLEVTAGTGYGRIDGVAQRSGEPVGGVMVILAPEDARDNQILFRRDQSDSDGTFSLYDIVPGRYRLLALADAWEMEWANPTVLNAFRKKSILVEVRAHDKITETVEVQETH